MMKEKNLKYWFRDFHNIIPGSDVLLEMSNIESFDIKLLPVTIINVQSISLFSQWYSIISSRLEDISKFCQESIFRRTGIKKNVKTILYPTKPDGKLTVKLKSLSHLWNTNQDDSNDCEIAFVITTDSNFLSFVETNNELFSSNKKRKVDAKTTETIETELKRIIYCPTVFINDEPQTSSTLDKYSRILAPLNFYLCATITQVLTENTAFGKILRGNTLYKNSDRLEHRIVAERGKNLFFRLLEEKCPRVSSCLTLMLPLSIYVWHRILQVTRNFILLQIRGLRNPFYPNTIYNWTSIKCFK